MSPRKILRIILSLGILVVLWMRVSREWHDQSTLWLAGSVVLSVILLLVIFAEVTGVRRQRNQVPKKPLGL
jgi:cell division protein FtsW (lipid II flippase)